MRKAGPASIIVGTFGELLITLGVLLGLFVVWQLYWTDVTAVGQHNAAKEAFSQSGTVTSPQKIATEHHGDPPVEQPPAEGTTFATFYAPRWGSDYEEPITEGTDKETILDVKGIGHYVNSQMPGAVGNFAVAGHRTTYGKPFTNIQDLKKGDALVVRTKDTWYVYKMTTSEIVMPSQGGVVAPIPYTGKDNPNDTQKPTQRLITLTACHPRYSAAERYIVHGELAYWAPASEGIPKELVDAGVKVTVGSNSSNAVGGQ